MIKNINDLNIFLEYIHDFPGHKIAKVYLFSVIHDKYPFINWDIQPKEILEVGLRLGIFRKDGRYIKLTQHGKTMYMLKGNSIDLNIKQASYLLENCIFTNKHFAHLSKFLNLFVYDQNLKRLTYSMTDYAAPAKDIEILIEMRVIHKISNIWIINQEYVELIDIIRSEINPTEKSKRAITQKQLELFLNEQHEIGERAEELTMEYEEKRLRLQKLLKQVARIKRVSLTDVAAGYDIESFTGKQDTLKPDLFIEVKSRKHYRRSFILSANELETAKKLARKFAIYFWNGLGYGDPDKPAEIILDPANTLKISTCENCLSYIIHLDSDN